MQAFPDAARALGDVGHMRALVMHFKVPVGAVGKELRAARPEVGEPGDELLRRQGGRLMEVDAGHSWDLLFYRGFLRPAEAHPTRSQFRQADRQPGPIYRGIERDSLTIERWDRTPPHSANT